MYWPAIGHIPLPLQQATWRCLNQPKVTFFWGNVVVQSMNPKVNKWLRSRCFCSTSKSIHGCYPSFSLGFSFLKPCRPPVELSIVTALCPEDFQPSNIFYDDATEAIFFIVARLRIVRVTDDIFAVDKTNRRH